MLPTVRTLATFDSAAALPQRSIAKVIARRTRTSSNGFFLWLMISRLPQFHVAEEIHQDYFAKYPEQGYCQVIINPKLAKARKYYSAWLNA